MTRLHFLRFGLAPCVTLLAGCSLLAPGVYVSDSNFEYSHPVKAGENAEIPILSLRPEVVAAERVAQRTRWAAQLPSQDVQAELGLTADLAGYQYRIGAGDVISINVWGRPELSTPVPMLAGAGEMAAAGAVAVSPPVPGSVVSREGTIYFPYVGEIAVANVTTTQARRTLAEKLRAFVVKPEVDLRVTDYRSQHVRLSGTGFPKPLNLPVTDRPMTVLDALAVGGLTPDANLHGATLLRNGRTVPVDLAALLGNESTAANWLLRDGDVLHLPGGETNRVFVMGEVTKQLGIPLTNGALSLADALSAAGGPNQITADGRRIFVIRGDPDKGMDHPKVFHLNANAPDALLLSTQFAMQPLDVVFVSTASVARFQRTLAAILPSFSFLRDLERLTTAN
ncbi:MAG TPA: polysaccharide biosynthesis/export family protein [Solimonas sp.]|nr:polysaccharide biosynthesis/export family protein [Solimonas sp.]